MGSLLSVANAKVHRTFEDDDVNITGHHHLYTPNHQPVRPSSSVLTKLLPCPPPLPLRSQLTQNSTSPLYHRSSSSPSPAQLKSPFNSSPHQIIPAINPPIHNHQYSQTCGHHLNPSHQINPCLCTKSSHHSSAATVDPSSALMPPSPFQSLFSSAVGVTLNPDHGINLPAPLSCSASSSLHHPGRISSAPSSSLPSSHDSPEPSPASSSIRRPCCPPSYFTADILLVAHSPSRCSLSQPRLAQPSPSLGVSLLLFDGVF
ncbi:hypothetical protein M0R45_026145 [Rubus argutus]|uniref:Uncharacterized protein n=1 Tax=Rubus argutus TaxID=59490 RepID=A0AAW1WYA8_RUBAR